VEASDGNTYSIRCDLSSAKTLIPWAGAIYAAKHNSSAAGCVVAPGAYKARWDKGRIKMLRDDNGKPQETTFEVLSSKPTVRDETIQSAAPGRASSTVLKLASSPSGADIELDGNFVGHTPSSVPATEGDHSIRITKAGYKSWERRIKTVGGEVTIAAELESEPK